MRRLALDLECRRRDRARAGRRGAQIPSPVEGKVVAINRRLLRNPSLIHNDPYANGWLYAVEPTDAGYTRLPYGEPSRTWFAGESQRFSTFIEHELGVQVRYVINTHHHADHTWGTCFFPGRDRDQPFEVP